MDSCLLGSNKDLSEACGALHRVTGWHYSTNTLTMQKSCCIPRTPAPVGYA